MYRCISSAKIHSRFGSSGRSMMLSKIVRKPPWGCGRHEDIFSSATQSTTSAIPEATVYQPWIGVKTPVPPPDVGAHERLAPRAGAVGEVVALAVDAVERVGRAPEADRVDAVEPDARAARARRDAAIDESSFPVSSRAADEPRHPGADDGHALTHAAAPPPAPEALGSPRHASASADAPVARRAVAPRSERPRQPVRLAQISLAERAAARLTARGRARPAPRRRGAAAACRRSGRRPRRCRRRPAPTPARR